QALYQLFTSTLSPVEQTRKAAEEQLKQLSGQNGFLSQLLQIVASPETPGSVRQAAAIYFKNRVSRGWHLPLDQEGTISAEDRTVVRDHILQVVMSDVPTVRVQLIASLGTVVQNDFPESWPAFAPTILAQLQSSQSHEIHTGIVAMHELSRVYQWSAADRRVAFYEMAQVALPVMHKLATEFLAHDAPEAGEMVKVVVKTYTKTIRIELAPWLQQNDQLVPWATLLLQLVDKPIPVDASVDPEEREKQSWWKAKKWASKCFHLIMTRYARPKDSTYGAFGQAFIENFAPRVLTAYLHQVQICAQRTTWMSQRHMSGIADFLESCVRFTLLWKSMKPHLEVLLLHFVFPLMYFTDEDMELWENDPVEYVHKRIDPPPSDMSSPTHAAQILLMTLVEKRPKQTFQPIFRFIEAILSNQPPANLLQPGMVADETTLMRFRDGALNMLATIAEEIVPQNLSVLHLEAFIAKYVLPSCAAEVPAFMRSRAMATLTHFDEVAWTQAGTWQALLHYAMLGLQDAQLAVRVNAALLLTPFFLREDADDATVPGSAAQIHEVLGQHAPQIMRILLQIQNEIEMDTIAHIMEMLVNQYSEQLAPAAVELAEGLAQSFFQLVADLDLSDDAAQPLTYDQEEETEGKSMAALGTLSTMLALCSAVDNSPVIMQQMQNVLCPVIMAVLQKRLVDLFEQTFEIIDACIYTFKDVTPAMWSLLPLIHSACRAEEMVYFDEMTPALVSYVQYGGKAAAEHP
ncbi:ARM repeat-containing protein, partial [Caulochytrium protostelioides]